MSKTFKILLGLCAAFAVLYLLWASNLPESWLRTIAKTICVGGLALAAALNGARALLVLGLALGALGDAFLSRGSDTMFMAGIAAFGLSHIAYIALFLTTKGAAPRTLLKMPRLIATLLILAFALTMSQYVPPHAGEMRGMVLGYLVLITAMALSAMALPARWPLMLAMIGAILFLASDGMLATNIFVLKRAGALSPLFSTLVWITYWLAQACFAVGFSATTSRNN